jgi:hypothetical protein
LVKKSKTTNIWRWREYLIENTIVLMCYTAVKDRWLWWYCMHHAALLKNGRRILLVTYHVPPSAQILNCREGSLIQSLAVGKLHNERVNDSQISVVQLLTYKKTIYQRCNSFIQRQYIRPLSNVQTTNQFEINNQNYTVSEDFTS